MLHLRIRVWNQENIETCSINLTKENIKNSVKFVSIKKSLNYTRYQSRII